MNEEQFKVRIVTALSDLCHSEPELLELDVHEDAITRSFVKYLEKYFGNLKLSIDTNWDKRMVDGISQKKLTDFLINQLPIGKRGIGSKLNDDYIRKEVLPDIIIHDRKTNKSNFLAIEIKKSTNKTPRYYDHLKVSVYTSGDLHYNFGAFIDFSSGEDFNKEKPFELVVYREGMIVNL